jgi:hypothetical protein
MPARTPRAGWQRQRRVSRSNRIVDRSVCRATGIPNSQYGAMCKACFNSAKRETAGDMRQSCPTLGSACLGCGSSSVSTSRAQEGCCSRDCLQLHIHTVAATLQKVVARCNVHTCGDFVLTTANAKPGGRRCPKCAGSSKCEQAGCARCSPRGA